MNDILTTAQAALRLSIKPGSLRRYVHRGVIQACYRTHNALFFDPVEIERYAKERKVGKPAKKSKEK